VESECAHCAFQSLAEPAPVHHEPVATDPVAALAGPGAAELEHAQHAAELQHPERAAELELTQHAAQLQHTQRATELELTQHAAQLQHTQRAAELEPAQHAARRLLIRTAELERAPATTLQLVPAALRGIELRGSALVAELQPPGASGASQRASGTPLGPCAATQFQRRPPHRRLIAALPAGDPHPPLPLPFV
jgi:hypothetical protein